MTSDGDRELDALALLAQCLREGQLAADLYVGAHALADREDLAPGVRVVDKGEDLGSLPSLSWVRLSSSQLHDQLVLTALRQHAPRLLLAAPAPAIAGAPLGAPLDEEATLRELGYAAIARIGVFLMFAPVPESAPVDDRTARSSKRHLDFLQGSSRAVHSFRTRVESGQEMLQLVGETLRQGQRSAHRAATRYRPPTLRTRKLLKLLTDPERFLRDARSPVLHGPALQAFELTPFARARPRGAARRETTVHDLPKRSLVIFCDADAPVDWDGVCEQGSLATELIVIAPASRAAELEQVVERASCPRLRIYLVAGAASGAQLVSYGIARSLASNLLLACAPRAMASAAMAAGFAELRADQPYWLDAEHGLVAARRLRLRDLASGEAPSVVLEQALSELERRLGCYPPSMPPAMTRSETRFAYQTLALSRPFSPEAGPRVFCLEKRPLRYFPVAEAIGRQQPKVSVIMTVFNAESTVREAIASVLGQSYANLELIAVDDGSDDRSVEILLELARADPRLKVVQTATNSGTYVAKNVGLMLAQGEYVSFHDSDDVSAGNRLELQVEALHCDPLAIANYTRYQRISESGDEVWFGGKTNRPGYITLMFRRQQVLEQAGFFDSVRISADAEFVNRLRVATGRAVRLLPDVCYFALQAEGSLTTTGAGAFQVAGDGAITLSPVRQAYRDASDDWHRQCVQGLSKAMMPFPLGQRPFPAPYAIVPDKGYSGLVERLVAATLSSGEDALKSALAAELQLYRDARFERGVMGAIEALQARKRIKDCRRLFQVTMQIMDERAPQSGLAFAQRHVAELGDVLSSIAVAQELTAVGGIWRPLEIYRDLVPEERRGPAYSRLEGEASILRDGLALLAVHARPRYQAREKSFIYHVDQSLPFHPLGYALRSQYLLRAIQAAGWQPTAVTRFGYPSDRKDHVVGSRMDSETLIEGVRYRYSPDAKGVQGLTPGERVELLEGSLAAIATQERACLIHSVSNHLVGLAGARAARSLGIPSIYEVRGLWHMTRSARQPAYEDSDHYRMIEALEVQAARESDYVLTLTGAMKELLIAGGVAEDKIAVLPNAVDANAFRSGAASRALVAELGLEGKTVIGFIGTMNDYEGLDLLIEAATLLQARSDLHLVLVGDGPARASVQELADKRGLQGRVTFTGRIPHHEVHGYYALLDIVVYPRKSLRVCEYVSPLKPFEALALGKAVVVSSVRALAEIVEDGVSGEVFAKGDAKALAACLQVLLDEPERRARLGSAARARVLSHHTWESIVPPLQELYERLLSSSLK